MLKVRPDYSISSDNTPSMGNSARIQDSRTYKAMVTDVIFIDDPRNITRSTNNPEVLYNLVIVGGDLAGTNISNARNLSFYGGNFNYHEMILTKSSKSLVGTSFSTQDGDIVLLQFLNGQIEYPIISGLLNGIANSVAASKSDGIREISEFNGLKTEINKDGEFTITRKGGSYDSGAVRFTPGTEDDSVISLKKNEIIEVYTKSGGKIKITADKIALGNETEELLDLIDQLIDQIKLLTVQGNLGFPTGTPINNPQFEIIKQKLSKIKGTL